MRSRVVPSVCSWGLGSGHHTKQRLGLLRRVGSATPLCDFVHNLLRRHRRRRCLISTCRSGRRRGGAVCDVPACCGGQRTKARARGFSPASNARDGGDEVADPCTGATGERTFVAGAPARRACLVREVSCCCGEKVLGRRGAPKQAVSSHALLATVASSSSDPEATFRA